MFLADSHLADLRKSGLSPETIAAAGLRSAPEKETREILGYGVGPGMVIPYKPWRDGQPEYARVKIDNRPPDGKRYRSPKGFKNCVYVPPILDRTILSDSSQTLYVTEGEKKALKATQEGFPCIALAGVWSWKRKLHGKSLVIPDFDFIEWRNRLTVVVFDSDAAEKPPVQWAEHALIEELRHRGAEVYILRLPPGAKGEKYGVDDFMVAEGVDAFKALPMLSVVEADAQQPTFYRMSDLADLYLSRALTLHHRIKLGMPGFDAVIRGVAPGEVLTVLGRAGVGKTAFALNLIDAMTCPQFNREQTVPTLVFSLEMQGIEMFERMASITIGMEGREIEGLATREDPMITDEFLRVIEHWNHVVVVDRPCNLERLDTLIGEANHSDFWTEPARVVVIDYLGMISAGRRGSIYEQVSEVAREVKNVAKRNNVATVLLCQVGRGGESGGEPVTLRMGRDSGVIEEAADYIIGIWRPELAAEISVEERYEREGIMKAAVLKNRCGPAPRVIQMRFEKKILRLSDAVEVAQ